MIVTFAYLATKITPDMPGMSHRLLSEGAHHAWPPTGGRGPLRVTGRGQVGPNSF
jgi:hypothetical protein